MRILFGVQGTGNGHISRSRTLARALRTAGVEVDYLFSGRPADRYFDMEEFGAYRAFAGLTFVSHEGRVSPWRTLQAASPLTFWRDLRALDCSEYDLVVSDFEPLTAHAARRYGKPSLTISHQASFNWPIPRWGEDGVSRQLMRHFAPVDQPLGLHWFHFGHPLLPPVIDPIAAAPDNGEILVYLPFEQTAVRELGKNAIVIRVQPDEGVTMRFGAKVPGGSTMEVRDVNMDFSYGRSFTENSPEAYERLILDVLLGDPPLFPTTEEVNLSWEILDPIEQFWSTLGQPQAYRAGTWGPAQADEMLARDGRHWRMP